MLAYAGHVLMENRNGLVSQVCLTHATGTADDRHGGRPARRSAMRR